MPWVKRILEDLWFQRNGSKLKIKKKHIYICKSFHLNIYRLTTTVSEMDQADVRSLGFKNE